MICLSFTVGCAGPTTPLGSIGSLLPSHPTKIPTSDPVTPETPADLRASIHFSPKRQVLHRPSPVTIRIQDPYYRMKYRNTQDLLGTLDDKAKLEDFQVLYNGWDVTKTFLDQTSLTLNRDKNLFEVNLSTLNLDPRKQHNIQVVYRNSWGTLTVTDFKPPACTLSNIQKVAGTEGFRPSEQLLDHLETAAMHRRLNPSLIAALIAQESSFNPKAVSWAKAIGLTQVTPVAEREIISQFPHFPRYPGIENFSASRLKLLISTGAINRHNEWRLNPKYSILGGIAYARYLNEQWSSSENRRRIEQNFPVQSDEAKARLVLASYNSGYSRVSYALNRHKEDWLEDKRLTAAKRYVNRVMSYCYHFSDS